MRVVVAGYQAISILHGGPNTQLRNTVRHFASMGIEARLFDPWSPFSAADCDLFHLFAANLGTYHLAREIHTLEIPLVVSPIIFSRHGAAFVRSTLAMQRVAQKTGLGIWSDYILTSDICSWASRILPNSMAESYLVQHGLGADPSKIVMVPNGVESRFANADPEVFRRRYGVRDFILNVGHIGHGRKNVLNLIRALGDIDHPAVIIGRTIKGDYGDACVREAAKHKHITLIDGLDHASDLLASAYAACRVFVLPSLFETPGIAALEAGLAGATVVITPYGGTREYFGPMAIYVKPDSVPSIRQGILEALNRKQSDDLREHIRRNYLWERITERTAAAYHDALGAH